SLGHLRAEGLIRSVRGSGSFVLAQPRAAMQKERTSPDRGLSAEPPPIDHPALLEFRIALESEAAALGSARRTADELATIAHAMQSFGAANADPAASLQADLVFHRAVAESSHNPYFTAALDDLGPAMITMPDERLLAQPDHLHLVCQEHS